MGDHTTDPPHRTAGKAERVALALSGGGSRAMAFHLGCLKALHEAGLLKQTSVISSVSGGSVIAALYCSHPGDFADFERRVRELLQRGFVWPSLGTALTTLEGVKAAATFALLAIDRLAAFGARLILACLRLPFRSRWRWLKESPFRRRGSGGLGCLLVFFGD
ncbi:patatin-like phospholipase family protein [Microvirga brassicacearum]|uniref:PNPLA domain-containing protein n=1 Tax=Microvirga brassicacearum TaxID=2580413 RepID=A0A5N3P7X1_9HYPH|nr:patatin-like phospholipase family protein [Microvirga brassicacearum]KAB0265827.1 hypothetical protein FEZ63_16765 [Microvirga brassicacearum]